MSQSSMPEGSLTPQQQRRQTVHDARSLGNWSSFGQANAPIISKRARQIQEDSGIMPAAASPPPPITTPQPRNSISGASSGPYRPPALRNESPSSSASPLESNALDELLRSSPSGSRPVGPLDAPNRGRARAGTLPSSWSGAEAPPNRTTSTSTHASARLADKASGMGLPGQARSGGSSPLARAAVGLTSGELRAPAEDPTLIGSRVRSGSNLSNTSGGSASGSAQGSLFSGRRAPGTTSSNQRFSFNGPTAEQSSALSASLAASRLRSGSLASGLEPNPFGQSIFSGNWSDNHRELGGHRGSLQLRGRGATIGNAGISGYDLSRLANLGSDPLDEEARELDDFDEHDQDLQAEVLAQRLNAAAALSGRDRATTMASLLHRPRFDQDELHRARSTTFVSSGSRSSDQESAYSQQSNPTPLAAPPMSFGQHGGLANAALQHRLSVDYGAGLGPAGRARAISVGSLDTTGQAPPSSSLNGFTPTLPLAGQVSDKSVSQDDLIAYALETGYDLATLVAAAAAAGIAVTQSSSNDALRGSGGSAPNMRGRAGTVAALGGHDARLRTERDLLKYSNPGAQQHKQAVSALAREVEGASSRLKLTGAGHVPMASGMTTTSAPSSSHRMSISAGGSGGPTPQQPTRSLWIGNLDPSTTNQELLDAFASYGAIENTRLLAERECAFVNFFEVADAMRAREEIMGRLGGRIGLTGTGANGAIRIGYGKVDSIPEVQGGAGGAANAARLRTASPGIAGGEREERPPTRALWIGSIPSTTTQATLMSLCQPYGPVESARVLTHKNCGFVNFERVDDAIRARKMLNGRDVLGPEVGAVRVGFASVPSKSFFEDDFPGDPASEGFPAAVESLENLKGAGAISAEQQALGSIDNYRSHLVSDLLSKERSQQQAASESKLGATAAEGAASAAMSALTLSQGRSASHSGLSASNSMVPSSDKGGVPLPTEMQPRASVTDLQLLMRELSVGEPQAQIDRHVELVGRYRPPMTYYTSIPVINDASAARRFDSSKLRDIKKAIEQGQYTQAEVDATAYSFLDSIVDLASDYIGNTVAQKFFEHCSEPVKTQMLERIAPSLAMIGIQKSGTWSAQKIIDMCQTATQKALIASHLRPYIPPLLLDQFGNYVVQCVLPYGSSEDAGEEGSGSDFIFDAMIDRCWEVAQGRFGARSMQTCLKSDRVSQLQKKKVATSVVLNSVPLATSPNGSLLLTWLLDSSDLPGRYRLLAPRLAPHLAHLCTHKLALTTVFRLVNQTVEPEAAEMVLSTLFESPNDATLEEIVTDQVHGSQFIHKVLTSPGIADSKREQYADQARRIITEHRLNGVPAYRKLVEDLKMPFDAAVANGGGRTQPPAASLAYQQPTQGQHAPVTMMSGAGIQNAGYNMDVQPAQKRSPGSDIFNPWASATAAPAMKFHSVSPPNTSPSLRLGHRSAAQSSAHMRFGETADLASASQFGMAMHPQGPLGGAGATAAVPPSHSPAFHPTALGLSSQGVYAPFYQGA